MCTQVIWHMNSGLYFIAVLVRISNAVVQCRSNEMVIVAIFMSGMGYCGDLALASEAMVSFDYL